MIDRALSALAAAWIVTFCRDDAAGQPARRDVGMGHDCLFSRAAGCPNHGPFIGEASWARAAFERRLADP
jgi:hypothetical protein